MIAKAALYRVRGDLEMPNCRWVGLTFTLVFFGFRMEPAASSDPNDSPRYAFTTTCLAK
jgi:hypothetical protein